MNTNTYYVCYKVRAKRERLFIKRFSSYRSPYVFFKKHFIMYLLSNKNYLCKSLFEEKTGGETRVKSFKSIFRKSEDIVSAIY